MSPRLPFPRLHDAAVVALTAGLFAALACVGLTLGANGSGIAAVWLPNAVLLGMLIRSAPGRRPWLMAGCFAANIGVNIAHQVPLALGLGFAAINQVEAAVALALLVRGRAPLDLSAAGDLGRFSVVAGLAAPVTSGLLATAMLAIGAGQPWAAVLPGWLPTSALGLLIGTPMVIALTDATRGGGIRAGWVETAAVLVIGLGGAVTVFVQDGYPFLFLIGPLVVLTAFRLGTAGTALLIAGIVAIGVAATAAGHGPVAALHAGTWAKLLYLQLFFLTTFLLGLPICALVTGMARTRAALRRQRDFGQSMLENMREVVFRASAEGRWVFLNPAWEQLTGHSVADSLGRSVAELLHPDDLAASEPILARIAAGDLPEALLQQRFIAADGACRHIEASIRALWTADGRFDGTIGNIRDVTERVRADAALRDSERRFQTLASLAPVGLYRIAPDGEVTYVNRHFAALAGIAEEQALGRGWLDAVVPPDRARLTANWQAMAGGGQPIADDFAFRHADGSTRWVHSNAAPVLDEAGAVTGWIGIALDITQRKRLELDLAAARDAAQVAAQAKADFLANMSHEIRTPMNGVIGFTELLLDGALDAEQRRYLRMIAESGRAMMRLLNDILDLSKIDEGHLKVAAEPMDLGEAVGGCVQLMGPLATRKGLVLDWHRADAVPERIVGDDLRFRQILLNLLGNAVKFTARGTVGVHLRVTADAQLEVEVRDTGIGIAPERQARIFERFVQADGSIARRYGGTGLGLTISGRLAHLLGGTLRVESVEGVGTRFFLTLPLVPVAAAAPAVAAGRARPAAIGPSGPRVLLAEDHPINQMLTGAMLDRLGCRVTIAADGAAAIAAVAASDGDPFALVLMDMQMPGVDGLEAARRLRAGGIDAATLPIVALTANAFGDDVRACLAAGMQGHLAKPLHLAVLAAAVRDWTGAATAAAA